MDALYREYIIDHYKHPRNFGELEPHDAEFADRNPLCGDELGVQVKLDGDRVADLRFSGRGCAISQAAASIISDELKGKTVSEIAALDRHFVVDELGVDLSPIRLKCALLSLKVVQGALLGTDEWPRGSEEAVDVTPEEASRLRDQV